MDRKNLSRRDFLRVSAAAAAGTILAACAPEVVKETVTVKETVIIETVGPDGNIRYWRDDEGRHHVPKRALDDIILG